MACQICNKVRPSNYNLMINNYDKQIQNYENLAFELESLSTKLYANVSTKIDSCVLPNLDIAVSKSDISQLTDNLVVIKNDINAQCDEYKKMANEAKIKSNEVKMARKNYIQTAWEEHYETVPCVGEYHE